MDDPSSAQQVGIGVVIAVLGTLVNVVGRTALRVVMSASIVAEIIGSVGLAVVLIVFHRVQPLSVLGQGVPTIDPGAYLALSGPFLVAMAFVGWSFVGFESAGAIAEEVTQPRRNLLRAILFSLSFIAVVVMLSSVAIILAIPDLDAVLSGAEPDPDYSTLVAQLGVGIAKPVQVLFLLSLIATDVYTIMVFFTSGGFYIAFLFPLLEAGWARATGRWVPGPWTLGRAGDWVLGAATAWAVFGFLNIAWPRALGGSRWLDWAFWIMAGGLAVVGLAVFARVRGSMTTWTDSDLDETDPAGVVEPAVAPADRPTTAAP